MTSLENVKQNKKRGPFNIDVVEQLRIRDKRR